MRKIFTFIAALAFCVGTAFAGTQIGNLTYNLNSSNHTAEVGECSTDLTGAIVIPATVAYNGVTFTVTAIGDYAFGYCDQIESITIPATVTRLGARSFMGVVWLEEITIPKAVTEIGEYAFIGDTRLTTITCLMTSLPTLGTEILPQEILSNITIRVPRSAENLYRADSQWNKVGTIETFDDTAIDQVSSQSKATSRKVIRDGVLYIERNGELFNLTGAKVN